MPIRPENRWLYPIDWPQLSNVIRFERAGGRCEGRPHAMNPIQRREAAQRLTDREGVSNIARIYAVSHSTIECIRRKMQAGVPL